MCHQITELKKNTAPYAKRSSKLNRSSPQLLCTSPSALTSLAGSLAPLLPYNFLSRSNGGRRASPRVEGGSTAPSRRPCAEGPGKHQLASGLAIMKINEGFNLKSLLKICSFLHSNSETHLQLIRTVPSVISQHTASVNTHHLSFITIKKSNKQWTRKQQFGYGSLQHNAVRIPQGGREGQLRPASDAQCSQLLLMM